MFIMFDFKLDVDSPYPIPTSMTLTPVPRRMDYPDEKVGLKHYGKYVKKVIRSLEGVRDQEAVQEVLGDIARYMRTKSYEYNQEHPNNEAIIKEIKRMSDYRISVDEDALSLIKKQAPVRSKKPLYANKKNGKNNKGPQRHNYSK